MFVLCKQSHVTDCHCNFNHERLVRNDMATKKTKTAKAFQASGSALPSSAHALSAIGKKTANTVHELLAVEKEHNLFNQVRGDDLKKLADALRIGWSDEQASEIVKIYAGIVSSGRNLQATSLCRWVLAHPNDASAVCDCMSIDPPDGIEITRLLSRAGSQKLVFLATWRLAQRQVVIKWLTGPSEVRDVIMTRETRSHPLSLVHRNIIETHCLTNNKGEPFLVEERLPVLLSDSWRSKGIQEASNLLGDIASALNYLHVNLDLVHGDIKPDNIGKKGEDYILLDFGICRKSKDFSADATATGSLRTRAPELITDDTYQYPHKVDIWALGATVFNSIEGKFPLFDKNELIPRVSNPEKRTEYEELLKRRVEKEWEKRVDVSNISEPIGNILKKILVKDPKDRLTAKQLIEMAEKKLTPYLRNPDVVGHFSPLDELQQLRDFLPEARTLKMMSINQKQSLRGRLNIIKSINGLSGTDKSYIENLCQQLS